MRSLHECICLSSARQLGGGEGVPRRRCAPFSALFVYACSWLLCVCHWCVCVSCHSARCVRVPSSAAPSHQAEPLPACSAHKSAHAHAKDAQGARVVPSPPPLKASTMSCVWKHPRARVESAASACSAPCRKACVNSRACGSQAQPVSWGSMAMLAHLHGEATPSTILHEHAGSHTFTHAMDFP